MKSLIVRASLLTLVVVVAIGCGPTTDPGVGSQSTVAPADTAAPTEATEATLVPQAPADDDKRGGDLHLFTSQNIGRVDPMTTQSNYLQLIAFQLHGALARYRTGTWEPIPDLAESWEVSEDGLTYTFHMRDGLKFHDGSPIMLSDVVFSLNRVQSDISVWRAQYAGIIDTIEAEESSNSVIVKLVQRDPFLLEKFAGLGGSTIYPQAVVEEYGDEYCTTVANSIGAGPFRLVEKSETGLVFERFEDFPEPAYVDRLVYRVIPDAKTQLLEFEAGNIDWMASILDVDMRDRFRNDPKYEKHLKQFTAPDRNWFGLNTEIAPFDDIRVRQAFAMAIDREAMVLIGGLYDVSNTLMHPQLTGYDPNEPPAYTQDVERAKELLAEAGYGDGLTVEFHIYNQQRYLAMAEVMQQQLAEIGVEVNINISEFGPHMTEVRKRQFPYYWVLTNIIYPDMAQVLYNNFHSEGTLNPGYSNDEVDSLLADAIAETEDLDRRIELAKQAERIVREDAAPIFVWDRQAGHVFQPWVHGVEDVTAIYPNVRLDEVWLDPDRR